MNGSPDYIIMSSFHLIQKMLYRHEWVMPHHPWTAPSHDGLHTLPHIGIVAVDGTPSTRRLERCVWTSVKAHMCIGFKLSAFFTKGINPMMVTAVHCYHDGNSLLFANYAPTLCMRYFHSTKLIKFHTLFIWKITTFKVNSLLNTSSYESSGRRISQSSAA